MKTFLIDIDNTLLESMHESCSQCGKPVYYLYGKDQKEIDLVNAAYDLGHKIIIFTGRGWNQFDITVEQLKSIGVKYHSLVMGKPDGVYIDKDSKTTLKGLF
jgi:hydroxymethylpyrimidine pyrophosphatase-like HAD family hydrolase